MDEALACRTTPKKFLFVPYVPGYVRAQGYAGLATALGKYKADREFVLLASINSVACTRCACAALLHVLCLTLAPVPAQD